jgi:hypothetical protein
MGKKTDRIEELEAELKAKRLLIQEIAKALDIRVEEVRLDNVVSMTARFVTEITTLTEREHALVHGEGDSLQASDRYLDQEIDRANAQGPGRALTRHSATGNWMPHESRARLESIAKELGVVAFGPEETLEAIYREIMRIKNPGADVAGDSDNPTVSKGDSLAQAIEHNLAQAQVLQAELVRNRGIVGRVAAAMQISQWDADGTEIIEKIQRWESFKHVLSKRIRDLRASATTSHSIHIAVADELEAHLARLMAPKEFAKWLETKPKGTVSPAVAELASSPAAAFEPFTEKHLADLAAGLREPVHLDGHGGGRDSLRYLDETFWDLAHSGAAGGELVRLMNLVVLPLLARQRAAFSSAAGSLDRASGTGSTRPPR